MDKQTRKTNRLTDRKTDQLTSRRGKLKTGRDPETVDGETNRPTKRQSDIERQNKRTDRRRDKQIERPEDIQTRASSFRIAQATNSLIIYKVKLEAAFHNYAAAWRMNRFFLSWSSYQLKFITYEVWQSFNRLSGSSVSFWDVLISSSTIFRSSI